MIGQNLHHGPYLLRPYRSADAPFIPDVVFKVLEEYGLVPEPEGVDNDLFSIEESYKNGFFGVVEWKGQVVGTFGLSAIDEIKCEIRKMYLSSPHRGKGLGKLMLQTLLEMARNKGYLFAELETASVLKEAVQLYLKAGFSLISVPNATLRCNQVYIMKLN